jgi:uncharacterized membrane protein HdeD (DUF308 family)
MRLSSPYGHDFFHEHGFFPSHLHDESGLNRKWLTAMGAVYLVLGLVGIGWLALMTVASVIFFGALALLGGFVQLLQSATSHGWRNVTAGALLGGLYLCAGLLMLSNPLVSSLILTAFLACALIALGIVRTTLALQHRGAWLWQWSALSGVLSIVIGVLILVQWPASGLFMIGLFVSLELMLHGAAAIALAVEKKSTV